MWFNFVQTMTAVVVVNVLIIKASSVDRPKDRYQQYYRSSLPATEFPVRVLHFQRK
ncbi:MAG: hypothetical protein ACJ72X_14275 [Nitrososphaeraceae archaeon]